VEAVTVPSHRDAGPSPGGARVHVEFRDVSKVFAMDGAQTTAIAGMSFHINHREFVALIGPSGCGKSTTLKLISGLDRPTSGAIRVDGRDVSRPSARIGFMLQKDLLLPWRTVLDNVMIGLEMQGMPRPARIEKAMGLIRKYGLGGFESAYPRHLSGGMRQRVALARTLAVDPDLLLLDEPLSALDFQTKLKMEAELVRILVEEKKTVLLITHDIAEAVSVADRVLICSTRPGRIKAEIQIPFAKGRAPLEARSHPDFSTYFNKIWREVESDVAI
jgi:NitT/TauT family transport system ATP-binding protein